MKFALIILKSLALVTLLVALTLAYLFFRIWQKNDRPEVESVSFRSSEVLLGHAATLDLTLTAPWHREISSAIPFAHPNFLVPDRSQSLIKKGPLSWQGTRTWQLSVPLVALDTQTLDGQSLTFPLKPTKRISPNSFTTPLPALTITTPAELPDSPLVPTAFLTEDPPAKEPAPLESTPKSLSPFWWLLLLAIPLVIWLLRRTGIIKTTPAWEKALAKLNQLSPETPPKIFYSNLTDILKQYVSDRYSVRARSKTSREFIQTLQNLPQIPNQHLQDLPDFARLADQIKFAEFQPASHQASASLDLIKNFVNATTPTTEEPTKIPHA